MSRSILFPQVPWRAGEAERLPPVTLGSIDARIAALDADIARWSAIAEARARAAALVPPLHPMQTDAGRFVARLEAERADLRLVRLNLTRGEIAA